MTVEFLILSVEQESTLPRSAIRLACATPMMLNVAAGPENTRLEFMF